ncbi:MAG: methyltransferase domain-containing protein [Acidobacteriota bacterium]|nr:methyltransferase domain-containing protein [Acidobacteriota bacterium]
MLTLSGHRAAVLWLVGSVLSVSVSAAQPTTPIHGQEGQDAPWVVTPQALVDTMLDMAAVQPGERLLDLGSGDGRVVISAAQRGLHAVGVELDAGLVAMSSESAAEAGVADRTKFVQTDLFEYDFADADVITFFLLPELTIRLRPTFFNLRPGTRIVSNTWDMRGTEENPEAPGWDPDETIVLDPCPGFCSAHAWTVPAKVEGVWRLTDGGKLELRQQYQMVEGELWTGGRRITVQEGRLTGTVLSFRAAGVRYRAEIDGATMAGTTNQTDAWRATRQP